MTEKIVSAININGRLLSNVNGKPIRAVHTDTMSYILQMNVTLVIDYNKSGQSNTTLTLPKGTVITVYGGTGKIMVDGTMYNAGSKSGYDFSGWIIGDSLITNTRTYTLTSDTIISAYWEEVSAVEYTVYVTVTGFDVTIDGKRKNLSGSKSFSGKSGTTYDYTLGGILSISGFTSSVSGLSVVGITDFSNASAMITWQPGIDETRGSSTPPTVLKQKSDNISGTITKNENIEWAYVYKYNGYYFI